MKELSKEELILRHVEADRLIWEAGLEVKLLGNSLFPEQVAFKNDKSKRKCAICSRRAGKTYVVGQGLLESLRERREGDSVYIGLTRGHAKRLMFNHLLKLKNKYGLRMTENRADLSFTDELTQNTLYITGAANEEDTEKIRGLKLKKVVLDEVASFRSHLNYLIEEVIEPTTIDLNGSIELIGTPSANPLEDNLFYRATTGLDPGWSIHSWTILNNPHIPHAQKWLDDMRERKQWGTDHPIYKREWLGLWTRDNSSLVYTYEVDKQDYQDMPKEHHWRYVVGVDLGFDDAFALVVIAFSYDRPNLAFVVDEYKKEGLIPQKMAQKIIEIKDRYKPTSMVADTGGLGKAIVEEFKVRYQLNIEPAQKSQKLAFIEILNGDLVSGVLKIRKNSMLATEMNTHQWDPENKGTEDDRTENHLSDALLYAWRKVKHYLGKEKIPEPKIGTNAHADKEAEKMLEQAIKAAKKQKEKEWY